MSRPLILASQSTARGLVLRSAGLVFEQRAARIDEEAVKRAGQADGMHSAEIALTLAGLKAARATVPGAVVIGADQVLMCEGRWFDKPLNMQAARAQLLALRGRRHELVTAVVCWMDGVEQWRHVERPALTMRGFSDAFLDAYLESEGNAVTTAVGAYRIEGLGIQLFERIEGEHTAILGLPLLPLLDYLRQIGAVPA